jgi:hypothetical protein
MTARDQLGRSHQSGEAGTHHDDVHAPIVPSDRPHAVRRQARSSPVSSVSAASESSSLP